MSQKTSDHPRVSWLPLVFSGGLGLFLLFPHIRGTVALWGSFAGAAALLVVWFAIVRAKARSGGWSLPLEVSLRPQHYLQAIAHTAIFFYWGLYWSPIKEAAPLIAGQIVFAYAFDMLLTWSRRQPFVLGFGPFPIIYSTNLFLRFRDDWFYLQLAMIAVGLLAKALFQWKRDGRQVHIFNPSSLTLALFSLLLILSGTTNITWGEEIATLLILPPQIYLFIFVMALPGQFLFRVTTMTLPAVLTTFAFSEIYFRITGVYFFIDSHVPIAVFLGMHLLFTDPSTSPRTELGRVFFGILYGLSVVGLYAGLAWIGAPTFYDKLLQVPLMNLSVRAIDRLAQSSALSWMSPARIAESVQGRMRDFAYVSVWIVAFAGLSWSSGLGDHHPGHTVPFWAGACTEGKTGACKNLTALELRYCENGSSWACNELGIHVATGKSSGPPAEQLFQRSCATGYSAGCANRKTLKAGTTKFEHDDPMPRDYWIIFADTKEQLPDQSLFTIYTRACERGWLGGCNNLARHYFYGDGAPQDKPRALGLLGQACDGDHALSCNNLGLMHQKGDGVPANPEKAAQYTKRACDLGLHSACP